MNSDRNKKENRKALKVFIPVIIACALAGALIGGFSSTETARELAVKINDICERVMYAAAPYTVMIVIISGLAAGFIYYRSASAAIRDSDKEKDEDMQYELYIKADENVSRGIMIIGVSEILSLLFFSIMVAYIEAYIKNNAFLYTSAMVVFIVGNFVRLKVQQIMVDFQKMMNPEKRGSVFDLNFRKKWEESCDEMEKMVIYKSAYNAYKTAMTACGTVFVALMLCSFIFDYGPVPATAVGIIWLSIVIAYYREAMRLGKDKINL